MSAHPESMHDAMPSNVFDLRTMFADLLDEADQIDAVLHRVRDRIRAKVLAFDLAVNPEFQEWSAKLAAEVEAGTPPADTEPYESLQGRLDAAADR